MTLPADDVLLLGPGPSPVSPRVRQALGAPARSHLDRDLVVILDRLREQLARVFQAPPGSLVLATSGTGTSAMEAAVANLVEPGRRALAISTGYFGDRLAEMLAQYGATVDRLNVEWGRAVDPADVSRALSAGRFDLVTVVHVETSTGVCNPLLEVTEAAHAHGALVVADTVTSLGAMPLRMADWGVDVCYSCSQKGLGAPSGLSPIAFAPAALARRIACRSFYFDLSLLAGFWNDRKYHHTISAPLVYGLHAALEEIEEEGLERRWARHAAVHDRLVMALDERGLSLLPERAARAWNLNAVTVPAGVSEADVRSTLRVRDRIEIGAGLGPLAGRIWRIGLMGTGAQLGNVERLSLALSEALPARASAAREHQR